MISTLYAYIEKDPEKDRYIAVVPGLPGAHACADTLDELQIRLKEAVERSLQAMDPGKRSRYLDI